MKQTLRTFVAVEASPAVRQRAAELIRKLDGTGVEVKWVEPHNLHLTLKFLGEVETGRIPEVFEAVKKAAAELECFQFEVRGAGAFPRPERARTIWLGAGQGENEMAQLARRTDLALRALGFPSESRGFQAHLTIGRVRRAGQGLTELARRLRAMQETEVGWIDVDQIVVFSSQLERTGPTYTALARVPLKKGG